MNLWRCVLEGDLKEAGYNAREMKLEVRDRFSADLAEVLGCRYDDEGRERYKKEAWKVIEMTLPDVDGPLFEY